MAGAGRFARYRWRWRLVFAFGLVNNTHGLELGDDLDNLDVRMIQRTYMHNIWRSQTRIPACAMAGNSEATLPSVVVLWWALPCRYTLDCVRQANRHSWRGDRLRGGKEEDGAFFLS